MNRDDSLSPALLQYYDIVDCIRRTGHTDRAKIANALDVSWPAVSKNITKLVEEEILTADGGEYRINAHSRHFVGIAVGTRNIKVSVVDLNLNPLGTEDFHRFDLDRLTDQKLNYQASRHVGRPILCYPSKKFIDDFRETLSAILNIFIDADRNQDNPFHLGGVGIAFPGAVDIHKGTVITSPNIPCLTQRSVKSLFDGDCIWYLESHGIPLVADHNAKAALISEREYLYHRPTDGVYYGDKQNVAVIYCATGIGASITMGGRLLRGASNACSELGHIEVSPALLWGDEKGAARIPCACGSVNCLEAILREKVFDVKTLEEYQYATKECELENLRENNEARFNRLMGIFSYIMNLTINLFNPEALIFTGRLCESIPRIHYDLKALKDSHTLPYTGNECEILPGSGRLDTVAIGMAIESYFFFSRGSVSEIVWRPLKRA